MSNIVGYLYKGQRYTPLAIKEVLIREGKIARSVFQPMRDLGGGLGYALPEPGIDTVVDAYAKIDGSREVFMDQPETYSDMDWPKFIFDDEVTEEEQALFTGATDLLRQEREEQKRTGETVDLMLGVANRAFAQAPGVGARHISNAIEKTLLDLAAFVDHEALAKAIEEGRL